MPQLHMYVPDNVANEVARRADGQGISVSRYLAELVRREIRTGWPAGFFEEVVGGWKGEPLTRLPEGRLEVRDEF